MMKSLKNRILGIIVCASLVLGMTSLPAFAEDDTLIITDEGSSQSDEIIIEPDLDVSVEPGDDDNNNANDGIDIDGDINDANSVDGGVAPDGDDVVIMSDGVMSDGLADGLLPADIPSEEWEAAKGLTLSSNLVPTTVRSGASTMLSFSVYYNAGTGTTPLDPAKLCATVTAPKGIDIAIVSGSEMFHIEKTETDSNGDTVITLQFDEIYASGGGITFDVASLKTPMGTIANDSTYDVGVKWTYADVELTETQINEITNLVDRFSWSGLTKGFVLASGSSSIYTPYFGDINLRHSLTNAQINQTDGRAYTKQIELENTITVNDYAIVTTDVLDNLVWTYNNEELAGGSYEVVSYRDEGLGYISQFKIKNTITNETLATASPQDIASFSNGVVITIKGVRVDAEKANAAMTGMYLTISPLNCTSVIANIYPCAEVSSSSLNQTDDQGERYQRLTTTGNSNLNFYFYKTEYYPEPTDDPGMSGRIEKQIKQIAEASGELRKYDESTLYAYPGDRITYSLHNFGNHLQTQSLTNYTVTDEFNLDEMYPIIITPGYYGGATSTNYVNIHVYIDDKLVYKTNNTYRANSDYSKTNVDLRIVEGTETGDYYRKKLDVTKINKVEFVYAYSSTYTTISPGFRPLVGYEPTITTVVRNQNLPSNPRPEDPTPSSTLTNTAYVSYSVGGTLYEYDSLPQSEKDIEYNFKDEVVTTYHQKQTEEYTGNKSYIKIRGKNPFSKVIEKDDLLEYTIVFHNPTNQPAKNPFFDDVYTGQVPYLADDAALGYDLTGAGYEEPFVYLVSVKDEMGYDVTEKRALKLDKVYVGPIDYPNEAYVYPAPDKEPLIGESTMRVRFKSTKDQGPINAGDPIPDYYIQPGDVITVTYVMKVTDPEKLSNKFLAYGYPIYSGDPELIEFTGGSSSGGGGGTAEVLKPTVSLTQTVVRSEGTGSVSSTSYPVEDGELLDVTLRLTNSDIRNAPPLTLYGFNSMLLSAAYNSEYPEVIKYVQGAAEVKIYKGSTDPTPEVRQITITEPPATYYPTTSYPAYKQKAAILFVDGANQLSPLTLNPSTIVEVKFQIEADGWLPDHFPASGDTAAIRDLLYSHAILDQPTSYYNGGSGSCTNWVTGVTGTKSYLQASTTIYISRAKLPYVQATVTSNYALALNNLAEGQNPKRTTNRTHMVQLQNFGPGSLPITELYVRLPENERFTGLASYGAYSSYTAKALDTLYGGRQVVVLTPNAATTLTTNQSFYLYLETEVDNETAQKMISDHLGQSTFTDSDLQFAFYSEGISEVRSYITTANTANRITEITEAEMELWGGADMGADLSKGVLCRANNTPAAQYMAYYPRPGISLKPLREYTVGGVTQYEESSLPFSPNERMAWRMEAVLYNNSSYLLYMSNVVAVLKLPSGVTYNNIVETNYTQAQTYTGADGYVYVVIPLEKVTAGAPPTITVSATLGPNYGSRAAEAFLMGEEEFYTIYGTPGWGGIERSENFPSDIKEKLGMTPSTNMVRNAVSIDVSGMFAFNSKKTVTVSGGGTAIDRGVQAESRTGQTLSYELILSNEGTTVAYNNVTIIDRLPAEGDKMVLVDDTQRGSTFKVTMKTKPIVETASVADANAGKWTAMSASKYTVEYVTPQDASPTYAFNNADFNLPDDPGDPASVATNWQNAASWPTGQEVSAFRITLSDSLPAENAVRVTFEVDAPEELMPKQNAKAVNSFAAGFQAQMSGITHKVKPEPDFAQVIFPDIKAMIIEGTVFTEDDDKVDGVYDPVVDHLFVDFVQGTIKMRLYKSDDGNSLTLLQTIDLDQATSVYRFDELYEDTTYYVEIDGIPDGYVLYETYVDVEQGHRFSEDGMTVGMKYEEGKTHRRNADILREAKGTLTLHKKLPGTFLGGLLGSDDGKVGGKDQKFVYRIDYTPKGGNAVTHTFYEVLKGNESRVVYDLPAGTYVVTEVAGWATAFDQVGGTAYADDNNTIDRATPDIAATCVNERSDPSFLHAVGEALNNFDEKTRLPD